MKVAAQVCAICVIRDSNTLLSADDADYAETFKSYS
jgi:hypothetical protein